MLGKSLHRGFEREDVSCLIEAHDWIAGLASRDCECYLDSSRSQVHGPCDICQARNAMDALSRVIDPRPITLHPERLTNTAELVYFELWAKRNERIPHLNGGYTLIEHLLCPSSQRDSFTKRAKPNPVTQHDMTIATSIIQWLGTNCGRCFIREAEAEIEKRNAVRDGFSTDGMNGTPESWKEASEGGQFTQIARSIASNFISCETHKSAHAALVRAIINALVAASKMPLQADSNSPTTGANP